MPIPNWAQFLLLAAALAASLWWLLRRRIVGSRSLPDKSRRDVAGIPAPIWLVCACVVFLATALALVQAGALPESILGPRGSVRAKALAELIGYLAGVGAACLALYLLSPRTSPATGLRLRWSDLPIALGALLLLAPFYLLTVLLSQSVASLLGHPPRTIDHETLSFLKQHSADHWVWIRMAVIVLLVPIVEEMVYRVFLGSSLLAAIGKPWPALLITAAIFAIVHAVGGGPVSWVAVPGLFVLGVGLGVAFEHTRRLGVPIVMHALFNAANIAAAIWLVD